MTGGAEKALIHKHCKNGNTSVSFIFFFIDVLNGYNGTIFAYGQTSSGKTHTMEVCFFRKFMVMIKSILAYFTKYYLGSFLFLDEVLILCKMEDTPKACI